MKRITELKRASFTGLLALILGVVTTPPASAGDLSLSDVPLFINLGVDPNVVVSIDDSTSMRRCMVPNELRNDPDVENKLGMTAFAVNKLYYNPNLTYPVPTDADGTPLNDSSPSTFKNAYIDGYNPGLGTVDLGAFRPCWDNKTDWRSTPLAARKAYYHLFSGDPTSSADLNDASKFTRVDVKPAEEENFTNWFSYYRNRLMAMKAAAGLAFVDPALDGSIRIAYQGLWGLGGTDSSRTDIGLMKTFAGQARKDFFTWLYNKPIAGGTPLRYTMHKVGLYYSNKRINSATDVIPIVPIDDPKTSPWAFEPGVTKDPEFTCRQAFHVLLSDGSWNNDAGVSNNADTTSTNYGNPGAVALPSTATSYTPIPPYKDSNSAFLADTAFHYWITDLRTDLANDVPAYMPDPTGHPTTGLLEDNPKNDPATWQHMVNFTVAFGLGGQLTFDDATYNDLLDGTTAWTTDKVDDMWHAAVNSRGQFLSAQDPQELVSAFTGALNAVTARTSSGAGVAQTTSTLSTDTQFFQGRFNSGSWTGQLLAFDVNATTGFIITPAAWDGGVELTSQVAGSGWDTGRAVLTHDGTQGVPFRWTNLTAAMQADLNKNGQGIPDILGSEQGQARLEYLRGSEADEGTNGNRYRARAKKLGDIVGSGPVFVGAPAFNYPDDLESSGQKYSTFRSSNAGRTPMVYVGANDGMLHGLDASNTPSAGAEKLAYVPKAVFPRLTRLTAVNYAHRFFVDGTPTVGDAFYSSAWHTVLVGGLQKGGQGIYALDVTDPAQFSEVNAAAIAKWEFTDANDADLGYTYSRPAIVRMHNDTWAAVLGNGYNNTEADGNASTSGNAVLFVLDIATGNKIVKIDTGVGAAQDPTVSGRPNGLATVAPVDTDGDRTIDLIYAGDLFGNIWKFDVRASTPGSWNATKLFTATDGSGAAQAITSRPDVGRHPDPSKGGFMIYFGTGKYIETSDNITAGAQTQTFYGIWDPDQGSVPPYDRMGGNPNLLEQQILEEKPVTVNSVTADIRITSDNAIIWAGNPQSPGVGEHLGWYMDLVSPVPNSGERQVTNPILHGGRIIFTTLIPSGSSCTFGGDGWLMELDAADGSRLSEPPFDIDGDGIFDFVTDASSSTVAPSGIRSTVGAPSEPAILDRGDGTEVKTISGSYDGQLQQQLESKPPDPPGGSMRQSWQQLR